MTSRSSSSSSSSSSTSSSSSSSSSSTSDDRSTFRTSGGSVTVQRRDDAIEVIDVTTVDGWDVERTSDDEQTLVVAFTRPDARVEVTIRLTATGITSAVSSASTG